MALVVLCTGCDPLDDLFKPDPFEGNTGPLTEAELGFFLAEMSDTLSSDDTACLAEAATVRAARVGDPQTLDPSSVALLPVEQWSGLDNHGKRLILTQVLINQATLHCIQGVGGEH
ncbi:MAG: hypothetical protein AAF460_15900 [Pseudomonadota bacterium]